MTLITSDLLMNCSKVFVLQDFLICIRVLFNVIGFMQTASVFRVALVPKQGTGVGFCCSWALGGV